MQVRRRKQLDKEQGNILFIIMLGIALFAALSLAVTQSGKNIGGAEREKVNLMAQEIIDYGAVLAAATQKMLISNSCDETDISFETAALTGYEHSPVAPDKCKMFGTYGGKVLYKTPDTRWLDTTKSANGTYGLWVFSSINHVASVGSTSGTSGYTLAESKDLIGGLSWLRKDVCMAINTKLGITNPNGAPPRENSAFELEGPFTGTYANNGSCLDTASTAHYGKYAMCIEGNGGGGNKTTGTYHFYQVLIAR